MKKLIKRILLIVLGLFFVLSFVACDANPSNNNNPEKQTDNQHENGDNNPSGDNGTTDQPGDNGDTTIVDAVDYASSVRLDMNSSTVKVQVTVKTFVSLDANANVGVPSK